VLETEIKKLTAALEANTAALNAQAGGANVNVPATPASPAPAAPQAAAQPAAPATAGPAVAPATPAPTQPAPVVPATQPAPPGTPQMTHQQAQAELTTIVQQLGDGAQVQATMQQYGSARLNEIPAENLFSMVQACKALIAA